LIARIWLPVPNNPELDQYKDLGKRVSFAREVLQKAQALPGVKYAAITNGNAVPLAGQRFLGPVQYRKRYQCCTISLPTAEGAAVSKDYFQLLGTPLLKGRMFADGDDLTATPVVLVNDALAQSYFPNQDPIGHRVKRGGLTQRPAGNNHCVVGNIKTASFDRPVQPQIYSPITQNRNYSMAVFLKTDQGSTSLASSLREQVQSVDPLLPLFGERTMRDIVSDSLAQGRLRCKWSGYSEFSRCCWRV
jgi:hypothetical protein